MGGNAIKSAQRIDKVKFDQYWEELKALFPEPVMQRTKSYRQKEDFGDIDVVVQTDPNINYKKMVKERVGDVETFDNGPFFSFLYKDAQVDFIFHNEKEYKIALHYYSWNDVCNFIGRVARTLNFKFGHDGLFYEDHLDDHYKVSIFVSNDIDDILEFLGYDPKRWHEGFDTIEQILEYGASSKYFNPLYFSLEEQNNIDRVRNKKRKMYQHMLKYIADHNLQAKPKLTDEEKETHVKRAILRFGPAWHIELGVAKFNYQRHLEFRTYFNGDIVKELTGLDGKELGKFMQQIKTKYPDLQERVLNGKEAFVKEMVLTTTL